MQAARPLPAASAGSDAHLVGSIREGARREAASRRATRALIDARQAKPDLRVVAPARRRVRLIAVVFGGVFALMLGTTVLEIRLAQSQLEIDRVEQGVELSRTRFTDLRKENAGLRSPERLLREATAMGMVTGRAKDFTTVSPETAIQVVIAAGNMLDASQPPSDPFAEHERLKRVNAGEGP